MKTINTRPLLLSLCLVHVAGMVMATPIQPVAFRVPAKMPDVLEVLSPADVQLSGMLGERVSRNERNRLAQVDLEPLLAGFRKKPGIHPWIGEHIGKWLHASTLAWANTGDAALRAKMDYAVAELAKAQEPDGYLGTYTPDKRFGLYQGADWDVWSHKYNLIGLLTYYEFTGNAQALQIARKVGDLLVGTFGPDKKSILSAGTHVGMAATSVLEPVVLLYRHTGDERYLEFAKYIVRSWDSPNGPQIIKTLLEAKSVQKTANGKAYEMLSNLVGLCELARATGDRSYLEPVLNAWEDIVAYRLYFTGSASQGEHFHGDYELPNEMRASVSETCVTTTWIQLNLQLLRLTGEARFGNQLEKTFLNHLSAAQRPDGAQWCYFTSLEGTKPYGPGINCCVSSGPRGMALAPQAGWLKMSARENEPETLVLDLFDRSTVNARIGGQAVTINFESRFPLQGSATLMVKAAQPVTFGLRIRTPEWAQPLEVSSPSGKASGTTLKQDGSTTSFKGKWTVVSARQWKDGDSLALAFSLAPRMVMGEHGNAGKAALTWGPIVLAYDQALNPGMPAPSQLGLSSEPGTPPFSLSPAAKLDPLTFEAKVRTARANSPKPAVFVPFADAGQGGQRFQVWLRAPGVEIPKNDSLSALGEESRSRPGNLQGSIIDGDLSTVVVTFDGKKANEDWFAVRFDAPTTVRRVVFAHGKSFHDGGWFDASGGKPRVEIRREKNGSWEMLGRLEDYPATTATDSARLKEGQPFTFRLPGTEKIAALRIIGKPASGDNPKQAFSSCAELQLFAN